MMEFIDLRGMTIPSHVLEMIPESLCRENDIIPFAEKEGVLQIAIAHGDENFQDTLQKLCFILNRSIGCAWSWRDDIRAAIDRHFRR